MIVAGMFAGEPLSQAEEMQDLADALYGGSTIHIDEYGVAHLNDETGTQSNGPVISDGTFAREPLSQAEEMQDLADALYGGSTIHIDEYGVAHLNDETGTQSNGPVISDGTFAGEPMTQQEEINQMQDALYNEEASGLEVDEEGAVHLTGGTDVLHTENDSVHMPNGKFAAPQLPGDPTQWYNKMDHRLFRSEVAAMRKYFPRAGFGFMKSTGNMYWIIDMKISQTGFCNTWRFMLVYDKDHPHNHNFGGSIKVCPIRPSEEDLKRIAREHGRPGVPHLLHDSSLGTYLCTRRTEDVEDGTATANTAVSVAAWAADWALHFEIGIRDKKIWNKWCDDEHFRRLMV